MGKILEQQKNILAILHKLNDALELMNGKAERQYNELTARLEINERSTRQIDEQLALSNTLRQNDLAELKTILERVEMPEEMTQRNHEVLIKELQVLRLSVDALNAKLSEVAVSIAANQTATDEKISSLSKGIFSLASQTMTDTRAVKESLESVEELLRLTAANQIMNLVDK